MHAQFMNYLNAFLENRSTVHPRFVNFAIIPMRKFLTNFQKSKSLGISFQISVSIIILPKVTKLTISYSKPERPTLRLD